MTRTKALRSGGHFTFLPGLTGEWVFSLIALISFLSLAGIHILAGVFWIFTRLRIIAVIAFDVFGLVPMRQLAAQRSIVLLIRGVVFNCSFVLIVVLVALCGFH